MFQRIARKMWLPMLAIFTCTLVSVNVYAGTGGSAKELDTVWTKVSDGVGGTWGKLASFGIIAASIWNREKIGMLGMGAGLVIGLFIPQIPKILDTAVTFTI